MALAERSKIGERVSLPRLVAGFSPIGLGLECPTGNRPNLILGRKSTLLAKKDGSEPLQGPKTSLLSAEAAAERPSRTRRSGQEAKREYTCRSIEPAGVRLSTKLCYLRWSGEINQDLEGSFI